MTSQELHGRVAVVTGGAQGIGRAICGALAANGATVVVADLDLNRAEQTAAEIAQTGAHAVAALVDVAEESSVQSFYQQAQALAPRLDILVNNAGICRMLPILDISAAEWDRILAVNLRGTFLMSREAFRWMKDHWKEYGQPQDVADAVVFLASDRARYITGEILDVNGGLVMD